MNFLRWFTLSLVVAGTPALAQPAGPDSTVGSAADAPETLQGAEPDSITVDRFDGTSANYARVLLQSGGFLRATHDDGRVDFILMHQVRSIRGPRGEDLTNRILIEGKSIPAPASRDTRPDPIAKPPRDPGSPALRGRPLPWKKGFPLIQGGLLYAIGDHDEDSSGLATAEFGYMHNISPQSSLGATLSLVGDSDYIRLGFKPRFRKWLSPTISLDFGAGLFASIEQDMEEPNFDDDVHSGTGFVGEISLSLGDWAAITTLAEVSQVANVTFDDYLGRSVDTGADTSVYLGVKVGGEPGIPASILMGLVAVAARDFANME